MGIPVRPPSGSPPAARSDRLSVYVTGPSPGVGAGVRRGRGGKPTCVWALAPQGVLSTVKNRCGPPEISLDLPVGNQYRGVAFGGPKRLMKWSRQLAAGTSANENALPSFGSVVLLIRLSRLAASHDEEQDALFPAAYEHGIVGCWLTDRSPTPSTTHLGCVALGTASALIGRRLQAFDHADSPPGLRQNHRFRIFYQLS